ncbi:MAG: UPF0182 family protein, partial [Jatrophihabitantaceae bacterium]
YIRNSVKATVDAYSGKVTLYAWDNTDPILNSWMSIFPNLVQPRSTMPPSIVAHVRYPQDLFKVQRTLLGIYHVDDPVQFYNVSRKWTVPTDNTDSSVRGASQPPYYVLAAASGSNNQAEFQLTSAMNVNGRSYLAAYISANSDSRPGSDYGKLTVLQLPPGSQVVQGPEQVYNQITSDNTINRDSLYATGGNGATVLHGNLLTLPLDKSFLYVEPLYRSNSTSSSYPILQRVIVVYGNKIGYGATLAAALSDFEPGHSTGQTVLSGQGQSNNGGSPTPTASPPSGSTSPPRSNTVTIQDLAAARDATKAALQSGDQVKIAQAEVAEQHLVDLYLQQHGVSPSGSTTAPGAPTSPGSPTASK